jgi:two-component system NtrC family sensor kinase
MMNKPQKHILAIISNPKVDAMLKRVLQPVGFEVTLLRDKSSVRDFLKKTIPDLMILEDKLEDGPAIAFGVELLRRLPAVTLVLFFDRDDPENYKIALSIGASDCICLPVRSEDFLSSVSRNLENAQQNRDWILLEARRATTSLEHRIGELETLTRLGQAVIGKLDLDSVFTSVVEAAVELTGSEEGSLMLLDEQSGDLYMRAARNFDQEFVQTFRLQTNDSLAGSVISTGQPVLIDENTPKKIATTYLVRNLIYVPLKLRERVVGVLGVDNRTRRTPLQDRDVKLLAALAEYTVIAIENGRLYTESTQEQTKLETLLARIQDVVILMDENHTLLLVNEAARDAFNLSGDVLEGRSFHEVFLFKPELIEIIDNAGAEPSKWVEIELDKDFVLSAQIMPIPDVGYAVTMHDITHLKRLDRLKSEFVSAVSHDLRSPLTAILGYVELIDRVGTLNEVQRDFVQRVVISVKNITSLVDDLLNLGRIEAGLEARKENVSMHQMIHYVARSRSKQVLDRKQNIDIELKEDVINVYGDPIQLRQMVENLLDNALKYTPEGGNVTIQCNTEEEQAILKVSDTGIGIPKSEQSHIFERFFRASNVDETIIGTGLGLAIVRSIVENHKGRIWVDSTVGEGTDFTIVLPLSPPKDEVVAHEEAASDEEVLQAH